MWGSLSRGAFYRRELRPKSLLSQEEPDGRDCCTHAAGFCSPRDTVSFRVTMAAVSVETDVLMTSHLGGRYILNSSTKRLKYSGKNKLFTKYGVIT